MNGKTHAKTHGKMYNEICISALFMLPVKKIGLFYF